jgi:predicted metal-dependent enzyme (double-stranded beta helix superfamily)
MGVAARSELRLRAFVTELDETIRREKDVERVTIAVKNILERSGDICEALPEKYLAPCSDRYARRLLHRDPEGRFTIVVMVWNSGQCTPLHDHAGTWCVECVARGQIHVTRYDLVGSSSASLLEFREVERIQAGIGAAGALIPPFEYHQIANPYDEQAVTIHVYGGEMVQCSAFMPEGDRYRREVRQLQYTQE